MPGRKSLPLSKVTSYVEEHIGEFHAKRLLSLERLKLNEILKRKNIYLFRSKHVDNSADLVRLLVDAYLSSQEETLFGDLLEGLAIFINTHCYRGRKSTTEGVDLEFDRDGKRYIVAIKSGPNWGNSSQIKRMRDNFKTAARVLRTGNSKLTVVAVNGCCYGRDSKPDKGDYQKLCGQRFWSFISGNEKLYLDIIEPLGHQARERNEIFQSEYSKRLNMFTLEFSKRFSPAGVIDWPALVALGSSK